MVKNKKAKGSNLERDIKRYFERWGYIVTKSGGSFGIDLIAIKKDLPPILINVKWLRKYLSKKEREELLKDAEKTDGIPLLAYKHVPKGKKNGKHCIEIINSLGGPLVLESLKHCDDFDKMSWILYKEKKRREAQKLLVSDQAHLYIPQVR